MSKTSPSIKPLAAVILLALSFAMMGVWARMMAHDFSTWQQVYVRILLAGIIATIVFRKQLGINFWRSISAKEWLVYSIRAIVSYVVGVGFFTIAVQDTQLATVSFVVSLPIMGVLGWLFFREKIQKASSLYIGMSIVGLALLSGVSFGNFHIGWGVGAAIIAMIGLDIGYLMSRHHKSYRTNFQNTTVLLMIGWLPILVVSLLSGERQIPIDVSFQACLALIASALFNIGGLMLTNYVFKNMKAYIAGNILLVEGIFALAIGFFLYGERPELLNIVGGTIVIVCAGVMGYKDHRAETAELSN